MSHFTRAFGELPRIRCRICGGMGDSHRPILFESTHPTVAYHQHCLQEVAVDEIDALRALFEHQRALLRGEASAGGYRLDIHELAGLLDQMDILRDRYSKRIDEIERLGKEAFALEYGP